MKYKIPGLLLLGVTLLPLSALAADFVPLVGIPGLTGDASTQGFGDYINAVYRLMISIGALMAVVKIVGAGAKYMLSDIVTSKSQAIKDIRGAIFGLLIVIGAVVILNTINASIVNTSLTFTTVEITGPVEPPPADVEIGDTLSCANKLTAKEKNDFDIVCNNKGGIVDPVPNPTDDDASCIDYVCMDRADIGEVLECPFDDEGRQEATFRRTCGGFVNQVPNPGAGCTNLQCDAEEAVPDSNFTCTGNSCSCTYDAGDGSSNCVTECTNRPGYLNHNVETANNRVTCNFIPMPAPANCTQIIGCCGQFDACTLDEDPNVCNVETSGTNRCYYILE